MTNRFFHRFQNRRMKHKKETANVKSVNKSPRASTSSPEEPQKPAKDTKPTDCHQEIVKRLMTHSQYYPASTPNKSEPTYFSNQPPHRAVQNQFQSYSMPPQYSTYNHQVVPSMYDNQQQFDFYAKDYYQHQQSYNQFANINTCHSPSLSPATNNFDQVSNDSPPSNYVFNGDFTWNIYAAQQSHPVIDGTKTQLLDHQPPYEIKSSGVVSIAGQLTPVTIESLGDDEIKNSFVAVKLSSELPSLSDDDVLSVVSGSSAPSPSAAEDWKFAEHQ